MIYSDIERIVKPTAFRMGGVDGEVLNLLTDSRRLTSPEGTIFFAITTKRNSGTKYIDEMYEAGVRSFVVPTVCEVAYDDANVWYVDDVILALQKVATSRREQYKGTVIGITGSNGKTIVKDWLVQLLSPDGQICASPKSYNSQIGVPLSVWQLSADDYTGIFEAGISEAGEMQRLQRVIQPTIGIFTTIGPAHDENFLTRGQKIAEKLQLFTHCESLVYCADHRDIHMAVNTIESFRNIKKYTWGYAAESDLRIVDEHVDGKELHLRLQPRQGEEVCLTIPFIDKASREDAMHCAALMFMQGYDAQTVVERCAKLAPVEMRLEMSEAIDGSLLINDSYSLDLGSLDIALDYLGHVSQHRQRTLILSDIMQTGLADSELYERVASLVKARGITHLVAIGPAMQRCSDCFGGIDAVFYDDTQQMIDHLEPQHYAGQTILLKGARVFQFERIAKLLQRKNHETVMEVDLDAMRHNLEYHRSLLRPQTKLMAMVKASSYGAGRVEVASALQLAHVDYLTVAYADEGVELRRGGIDLPIMVMNPEEASFDDIIHYRLEPDIYSFRIMQLFVERLKLYGGHYPIHIEFDTGMHRLGFVEADLTALHAKLREQAQWIEVRSVFTHLACADDPAMDDFTRMQIDRFRQWSDGLPGLKHILNSSGITRFTDAQLDMVRLGIGLYGISPEPAVQASLQQVSRLVTRVSQIKDIPAGESVGYNCRWVADRNSRIAIITIGYADGLHRGLGYGRGHVLVGGCRCPIVGSVCMDMCFVDVTDCPSCVEGDRVVIFGDEDLLQHNAAAADTIPYELLTAVSPRVKRIYYHQS